MTQERGARTVALVISHMTPGGAQRQLVHLACGLERARWRPVVFCFGAEEGLCGVLREAGVPIVPIRRTGRADPVFLPRLTAEFRRWRPFIVHTTLRTANLWGRAAALLAGVPHLVASERNVSYPPAAAARAINRFLGRRTDAVIVNSAAGVPYAADQHAFLPTRVTVIPNGVVLPPADPDARRRARAALLALGGWAEPCRLVVILSNLEPHKRVDHGVELARRLKGVDPPIRWIVFGDGTERPAVERAIRDAGLSGEFLLAGRKDDAAALLVGADGLVHPSEREGMPNAVMEAMAAGIPVVATGSGGTPELIEPGRSGWLAPIGDLHAMETHLRRMLDTPAEAARVGAEARRRAEASFSVGAMVAATETCYGQRCLDERPFPRVAVVMPRHSERCTFIVRELRALRERGGDVLGYSLLVPEALDGRRGRRLGEAEGVEYLPFLPGPTDLAAMAAVVARRPAVALREAVRCTFGQWSAPRVAARSAAVFPKAVLLAARVRRLRAETLHAHWATVSATMGLAAARLAGVPFSFTGHAWDLYFDTTLLGAKLREARFVAVCNRYNRERLVERYPHARGKVAVVYHGLDLSRFAYGPKPGSGERLRILAVGRLVEKKGFDTLVLACGLLHRRGVLLTCEIFGEGGPQRELLEGLIEREAPGLVRLRPYLTEDGVIQAMGASDVLAVPSRVQADGAMDGIPNVVIEAMAVGLPVVTTAVAGIPEIARADDTALVVPPRDPERLAEALLRLRDEPGLGERLRRQARTLVEERFDQRRTAVRLLSLLSGDEAARNDPSS